LICGCHSIVFEELLAEFVEGVQEAIDEAVNVLDKLGNIPVSIYHIEEVCFVFLTRVEGSRRTLWWWIPYALPPGQIKGQI